MFATDGPRAYSAPYQACLRKRKVQRDEVAYMEKAEVAVPVVTERPTPIVSAPKKDEALQLRVDYRRLFVFTEKDWYTVPYMDECIDFLG